MLDRNCLAYFFSVMGWELSREEQNPLLKAEANSDEANRLTMLLTPGSESSGCEWCISSSTTILVSNTPSLFKFTNYPVTPLYSNAPLPNPLQVCLFSSWRNTFQEAPDDFPVRLVGLNWIACPWWDRSSCSGQWLAKEKGVSRLSLDLWWFILWAWGRGCLL